MYFEDATKKVMKGGYSLDSGSIVSIKGELESQKHCFSLLGVDHDDNETLLVYKYVKLCVKFQNNFEICPIEHLLP